MLTACGPCRHACLQTGRPADGIDDGDDDDVLGDAFGLPYWFFTGGGYLNETQYNQTYLESGSTQMLIIAWSTCVGLALLFLLMSFVILNEVSATLADNDFLANDVTRMSSVAAIAHAFNNKKDKALNRRDEFVEFYDTECKPYITCSRYVLLSDA